MSEKLVIAAENVGQHMDAILSNFLPGAKITVLVRRPGEPERDFMMTDDDPLEAIAMIQRRTSAPLAEQSRGRCWKRRWRMRAATSTR